MDDSLNSRGKAMEELFFKEKDQQLLEKIRNEAASKEQREALQNASGIEDAAVLDALTATGITPESLMSVSLIPLVAVAWADKKMEDAEKAAILQAAEAGGIDPGSASYETMKSWLEQQPGKELLDAWKSYIVAIKDNLEPAVAAQLKTSILGRAESVAKSAGGFLGIGNKVSSEEQKVLGDLANTFG